MPLLSDPSLARPSLALLTFVAWVSIALQKAASALALSFRPPPTDGGVVVVIGVVVVLGAAVLGAELVVEVGGAVVVAEVGAVVLLDIGELELLPQAVRPNNEVAATVEISARRTREEEGVATSRVLPDLGAKHPISAFPHLAPWAPAGLVCTVTARSRGT